MEITNKDTLSCSNYLANLSSPPSLHPLLCAFFILFYLKNKGNYHCRWFANYIQMNSVQLPFKPPSEDQAVSCRIFS